MIDCAHFTLEVNEHASEYQILEQDVWLREGDMLIVLLEVYVERSILGDFTETFASIELEFQVGHVVAISRVPFAVELPDRNLLRTVLDFLGDELDLVGD